MTSWAGSGVVGELEEPSAWDEEAADPDDAEASWAQNAAGAPTIRRFARKPRRGRAVVCETGSRWIAVC